MPDSPNIKTDARRFVDSLPDSATWDDLAYEVYVRQAIEAGLADADADRTLSNDEALAQVRSRIRRASMNNVPECEHRINLVTQ
jgi:predicted transcriptional regulator